MEEKMIEMVTEMLRDAINKSGDTEIALCANDYGFANAWIEEDGSVWWDSYPNAMKMDELTELVALYEVIKKTEEELDEEQ